MKLWKKQVFGLVIHQGSAPGPEPTSTQHQTSQVQNPPSLSNRLFILYQETGHPFSLLLSVGNSTAGDNPQQPRGKSNVFPYAEPPLTHFL